MWKPTFSERGLSQISARFVTSKEWICNKYLLNLLQKRGNEHRTQNITAYRSLS